MRKTYFCHPTIAQPSYLILKKKIVASDDTFCRSMSSAFIAHLPTLPSITRVGRANEMKGRLEVYASTRLVLLPILLLLLLWRGAAASVKFSVMASTHGGKQTKLYLAFACSFISFDFQSFATSVVVTPGAK